MPSIVLENLAKTYRGKKRVRVQALNGISLSVEEGEVFGFLGPNGAGKSTTIKILTGQVKPSAGSAHLAGRPVQDWRCRRDVGYLPENPAFYDFLTARELLEMVGRTFGMESRRIETESARVLELLGLEQSARRPIRSFSKGMVQRLGMAQALLHDPPIYILDEPMSGLDPMGRALVKELILDLKRRGKTVFFSTHITADVEAVCDRVGVLAGGCLRADERVDDVLGRIEGRCRCLYRDADDRRRELVLPPDRVRSVIEELWAQGCVLERLEPESANLEQYFLAIVAAAAHEAQS